MIEINPAWAGKVQFYELVFGMWMAYAFLVLLWEKILRAPLPEWRYMLLNFMGGGAFAYTVVFIAFEQIARYGVEQHGVNEFWFMAASYLGFIAVIVWRGRARTASPA